MRNTKKGFTLVELLVVIAILAVLATVSVVGYTSFIDRANQSTALQEMTQIRDSVIAEDILNPNFSISGGTITVADNTDTSYPNFNDYVKSLTDALGEGRSCDELATGANALVLKNTDKKVQATWSFATNDITTEKYTGNDNEQPGDDEPACSHQWVDATCTVPKTCSECGETEGEVLPHDWEATDNNAYEECSVCHIRGIVSGGYTLVTDVTDLKAGDQIVIVGADENTTYYALGTTQNNNNRAAVVVTANGNVVTFGADVQIITLEVDNTTGLFAFNTGDGYLYAASSSSNHLRTKAELDDNGKWSVVINDGATSVVAENSTNHNVMQFNYNSGKPIFSCYSSASQIAVSIYKFVAGETTPVEEHNCNQDTVVAGIASTCTETGLEAGAKCSICGKWTVAQEEIDSLGHDYVDDDKNCGTADKCSVCQAENPDCTVYTDHVYGEDDVCSNTSTCIVTKPTESTTPLSNVTITFDESKTNRTSYSTTKQVWSLDGLTFTNEKASSTNNVGDYSDPVRLYQSSSVKVEGTGIHTVVIESDDTTKYITALTDSLDNLENATVTAAGSIVTIVFNEAVDSFEFSLTAQARLKSITVNP